MPFAPGDGPYLPAAHPDDGLMLDTPAKPFARPLEPAASVRPDPLTEPALTPKAQARLEIIDKLRGFVIVLMVLDHVRHFFHGPSFIFSPTDLDKTAPLLFATRWVTHLCAPTFVFLAGVSVYLQRQAGKRGWRLARFLLTRGLWLIVLEVTLVGFGFNFAEPFLFLQVIWAIGAAMILLAGLAWAPPRVVLAIGLVIVAGHDLLTPIHAKTFGVFAPLWTLMVSRGTLSDAVPGYVAYPAIPWFGIMALGFGAGALFEMAPARRNRALLAIGAACLAAFAVLRGLDHYGDVASWTPQADATHTVLSFLKVSKYPPSLDYTLATLGFVLLLAPLIEHVGGAFGRLLHVFGRTPLFTYLVHLYVAHGLALLVGVAMGFSPSIFFNFLVNSQRAVDAGWGFGLPLVYIAWVIVVLALWPLSAWYAGVKQRRRDWWLSYL